MSSMRTTDDEVASDDSFVEELRDWLADHLVGEFAAARGVGGIADDSQWELRLEWERLLARDRWLNLSWPEAYGGRGGSIRHELLFHIEHARAGAPYWVGSQGRDLFGPTLMAFGTQEQKDRFIPPIVAAEEFWGQGFSEPGAGSDLASLRTSARLEGDRWIIDGQKIWMTFGDHADWLYVLCRTSKEAPKHRGISMLLVPRHQAGVEVRTIRNIAGGAEFCEVFFTGAETEADLVVGGIDEGWQIVMATLGNERGGTTVLPFLASFERQMDDLLGHLRQREGGVDPVTADRVVRSWQEYRVLRQHTDRVLGAVLEGRHPGPESSLVKLFWGTWHRDFGELLMEVLGHQVLDDPTSALVEQHRKVWLDSRAETIYGGTVEIQKNIIGERVLGLPR